MYKRQVQEFATWQEAARLVRELSCRRVNMYRGIISFSPETAAELGLTDRKAWEDYMERHILTLAKYNGIRVQNLQWVAAHHNERGHPHIHVVFWDKNQRTMVPFVHPSIPDKIRRQLIRDTFAEKIQAYCETKQRARERLTTAAVDLVDEFEQYMEQLHPTEYKRLREAFGHITDDELGAAPLDGVLSADGMARFIPCLLYTSNLEAKLEKLSAEEKKDDLLTFEQLGVDMMFVDEAHFFKNCFVFTKLRNVAGITTSSSQRAFDMLLKCQYLQEVNNGRGVIFATGTPISNSLSEMFVMQRYLPVSYTHLDVYKRQEIIRGFRGHPFRLYEGDRFNDLVDSVSENGVLSPTIIRKIEPDENGFEYEMLAGHNRQNAAIAAKRLLPCIVKENLSDQDAWIYVIETNVLQRSFSEMFPSERAAVLAPVSYTHLECFRCVR